MLFVAEFALVKKEFITNLRARRPFILLMGAFLLYSFMLASMWPERSTYRLGNDISEFVMTMTFVMFIMVNLFVPGMAAGSFTSEREGGTYDMLKGTLLTSWKLVLAKFLVILFFVLVLMASVLPIFASCLLGGGISTSQIVRSFICIVVTSIFNILFSFYASLKGKSTSDSVRKAYVAAFMTVGGISIVGSMFIFMLQMFSWVVFGWNFYSHFFETCYQMLWAVLSPWYVLMDIFYPGTLPIGQWSSTSVYALGSILLFFMTMRYISREEVIQLKQDNRKKIPKKMAVSRKVSGFILYVLRVSRNAIAQKELYTRIAHLPKHQKMINIVGLLFLFGITISFVLSGIPGYAMVCFQMVTLGILVVGYSASLISKDIENEEFDLIRSTLITPIDFILGKFQAVCTLVFMPLVCCASMNYLFLLASPRSYNYHYSGYNPVSLLFSITFANLELFAMIAVHIMVSIAAGAYTKKTSGATVLAYFLNFFLFYGGIVLFFLLIGFFRRGGGEIVTVFFPCAIVTYLFENTARGFGYIILHAIYLVVCMGVSFVLAHTWIAEKRWVDP